MVGHNSTSGNDLGVRQHVSDVCLVEFIQTCAGLA